MNDLSIKQKFDNAKNATEEYNTAINSFCETSSLDNYKDMLEKRFTADDADTNINWFDYNEYTQKEWSDIYVQVSRELVITRKKHETIIEQREKLGEYNVLRDFGNLPLAILIPDKDLNLSETMENEAFEVYNNALKDYLPRVMDFILKKTRLALETKAYEDYSAVNYTFNKINLPSDDMISKENEAICNKFNAMKKQFESADDIENKLEVLNRCV